MNGDTNDEELIIKLLQGETETHLDCCYLVRHHTFFPPEKVNNHVSHHHHRLRLAWRQRGERSSFRSQVCVFTLTTHEIGCGGMMMMLKVDREKGERGKQDRKAKVKNEGGRRELNRMMS